MTAEQRPGLSAGPRDLTGLVMPRGLAGVAFFLALVMALGGVVARDDTRTEIAAALSLAAAERTLHELSPDDGAARGQLQGIGELRHVALKVTDGQGRILFESPSPAAPALLRWAMRATGGDRAPPAAPRETWSLPRPGGAAWTASIAPSPASEQIEAWQNLFGLFALMLAWSLLSLALLRWNIRRAFQPLERMLRAIRRLGDGDASEASALPAMPIAELDATAAALRQLAGSLRRAEEARRRLASQVQTLQEDERQRLARDLHDDFGQRLTALRADLAWLRRRPVPQGRDEPEGVLADMDGQIARLQRDLRGMLSHLQPLGPHDAAGTVPAARLAELLEQAAAGRHRSGDGVLATSALLRRLSGDDVGTLQMPSTLVLALFRMTQEAFTNTARHAAARHAEVHVEIDESDPGTISVRWRARDDGAGLTDADAAWRRGNGLAGMRERVWALEGEFGCSPGNDARWPGLHLHASVAFARAALPS
jgi:two-component system sensor histidine kinase UhpB